MEFNNWVQFGLDLREEMIQLWSELKSSPKLAADKLTGFIGLLIVDRLLLPSGRIWYCRKRCLSGYGLTRIVHIVQRFMCAKRTITID